MASRSERAPNQRTPIASYQYSKGASGLRKSAPIKERVGARSAYVIFSPAGKPYLPSDEVLRSMISRYTGFTFERTERFPDRSLLVVKTTWRNLFGASASRDQKTTRSAFLRDVARVSLTKPDIPDHIYEACAEFLKTVVQPVLVWTGKICTIHDGTGERGLEIHLAHDDIDGKKKLKDLSCLCKTHHPFTFRDAPP